MTTFGVHINFCSLNLLSKYQADISAVTAISTIAPISSITSATSIEAVETISDP
jgi:hypothetical protein